jgi:integrase
MEYTARVHIFPSLGPIQIEKLTRGRLEHWLQDPACSSARLRSKRGQQPKFRPAPTTEDEKRARRSSAHILAVLKASLNHAVTTGYAGDDSASRWVNPFRSVNGVRMRFLDLEDQRRFVSSCEGRFRVLVQGALYSGCRYEELCRLRTEDFQNLSGTLFIASSKSGIPRHVHLTSEAVSFFKSITVSRQHGNPIFMRVGKHRVPGPWKKVNSTEKCAPLAKEPESGYFHFMNCVTRMHQP